jgi:hypothetical protein
MRIIEAPNMETVCGTCGCHFEFDAGDVVMSSEHPVDSHTPDVLVYQKVACPVCKNHVRVWHSNVGCEEKPVLWRQKIEELQEHFKRECSRLERLIRIIYYK